jgi:hypothetical protein
LKYGILLNKNNLNIGDDIQAYATAQFYPKVDYFIDRENMLNFRTDDGEPVAVIMNAWYMWKKWNWPPSKYIYPLFVGFHYADHQLAKQPGSPFKYEFLTGEGGAYLNAWGPVGTRDHFTEKNLKENGVDAYFSGCITLTLPKQKIEDRGRYICVVDVDEKVTAQIQKQLKGSGIEVRVMTHNQKRNAERTWEQRESDTVERLTEYQNAICVVTKRLHCALPCLAMEVPVLLVKDMTDDIRFDPYYSFLHWVRPGDFLKGKCDYDLANPPENKPDYKPVRENLIKRCQEFVVSVADDDRTADEAKKYKASEETVLNWRIETSEKALDKWKQVIEKEADDYLALKAENKKLTKEVGKSMKHTSLRDWARDVYLDWKDKIACKKLLPDYDSEWKKIEAQIGKAPESDGIEKLRYEDKRIRRMLTRLLDFAGRDFRWLRAERRERDRLKKELKQKQ